MMSQTVNAPRRGASVHPDASIHPTAIIDGEVTIGPGTVICPFSYLLIAATEIPPGMRLCKSRIDKPRRARACRSRTPKRFSIEDNVGVVIVNIIFIFCFFVNRLCKKCLQVV